MSTFVAQPKWPTLRWVVGELKYYAIAATIAGLGTIFAGFVLSITYGTLNKITTPPIPAATKVEQPQVSPDTKLTPAAAVVAKAWDAARASDDIADLFNFAKTYPNTSYADEAWRRMNNLAADGKLRLASLSDDADFIGQVLYHEKDTDNILGTIAAYHKLDSNYNYGYAVFYSDGHKVVHSQMLNKTPYVVFDPSSLGVKFSDDKKICIDSLKITANGRMLLGMTNVCFGGDGRVQRLIKVNNSIELDAEPLGQSQYGLAWAIGVRGL